MLPTESMTVLQLGVAASPNGLDRAYRASVARYERLTSRGPLQFFRRELLADAQRAFETLRTGREDHRVIESAGPSLLRRRAEQMGLPGADSRVPVRASEKMGPILAGHVEKVQSRSVRGARQVVVSGDPADNGGRSAGVENRMIAEAGRAKALIEDRFACEVIYRLEGDLIRYSSRCELLQIAKQWGLSLFQANMLIAQIVEAVRQNHLYEIGDEERQLWQGEKRSAKRPDRDRASSDRRNNRVRWLAAGLLLAVAVAVEAWLIRRWVG